MSTNAASALAGNAAGETGGETNNQGQNGGGAAAEKPWHEAAGIDAKYVPAITAKGWTNPNDVLESYTNVEKLVSMERGGDIERILVKPKADATPEEIAAFNSKAGFSAPETVEGYGFTPESIGSKAAEMFTTAGLPADLAGQFSEQMAPVIAQSAAWFKEAGVPAHLASAVVEQVLKHEVADLKTFQDKSNAEYATMQTQMGDRFADFEEAGRRAFKQSGLEAGSLDAIERAIGSKAMLTMFAKFGSAMTEAQAPNGSTTGGAGAPTFTPTAQSAQQRIETLRKDSDFQAKLLSPDPNVKRAAVAEWERLHTAAYPPA